MRYLKTAAGLLMVVGSMSFALLSGCASKQQTSFDSPSAAVDSFVSAIRTNDEKSLHRMFGPDADDLIASGDEVADQNRIKKFLALYDERHELQESDQSATLVVGNKDWPFPIPVVKDEKGKWSFDTAAGKEEILNRRIGQNELDVIQVCEAIVDAQQEYAMRDPAGAGIPVYATKFLSDEGKKNGLFWPTAEGETPSPLGPFVAGAVEEGYTASEPKSGPRPFHGYCYRMLKSQGANAPGGALDYEVQGKMIGGFAVIAYPAEYGSSGIMSFMVSHQGIVYQKDLGEDTESIAKKIESFDPGPGWKQVPAKDEAIAGTGVRP